MAHERVKELTPLLGPERTRTFDVAGAGAVS
jgi:hypothetical protein